MSDMKKLIEAMDRMSKAASKPTGPKFPGYWKGTDPASKAKDRMVGGAEESIIKELGKTAKEKTLEWSLAEALKQFKEDEPAAYTGVDPIVRQRLGMQPATQDEIRSYLDKNPPFIRTTTGDPVVTGTGSKVVSGGQADVARAADAASPDRERAEAMPPSQPVARPLGPQPADAQEPPAKLTRREPIVLPPRNTAADATTNQQPAPATTKPTTTAPTTTKPVAAPKAAVSQAELQSFKDKVGNQNATLGQYLNSKQNLTARAGGANDPDVIQKRLSPGQTAYNPTKATAPSTANPPNVRDLPGGAGVDQPEPNSTTPNLTPKAQPAPARPPAIDLTPGGPDMAPNKSPNAGRNPQLKAKVNLPPTPEPGTLGETLEQKFARLMQEQEADYGDKYQAMVQRVGQKAGEQQKRKPVDVDALVRKLQAVDKKFQQVKQLQAKRVAEAGEAGAQDPTAQATSPAQQSTSVGSTAMDPAAQKAMKDQQVDVATAKGTVSGLKDLLGPQVDTNAAASGIAKANDNKPLNKQEQQSVAGLTPLMMKAAETPAVAQQLKTALSTAGMLSKLGK